MTGERLRWNIEHGLYDLGDHEETVLALCAAVESDDDARALRDLIAEIEARAA